MIIGLKEVASSFKGAGCSTFSLGGQILLCQELRRLQIYYSYTFAFHRYKLLAEKAFSKHAK